MRRYLLGISALLLAGCATGQPGTSVSEPTSPTQAPAPTTTGAPVTSPSGEPADLIRVLDGDSLVASVDGAELEVRLIGINAPEGDECYGEAARQTLETALASGDITLVADDEDTDQYGRALRYVYVDGLNVNLALLADGDAVALQTGHAAETEFTEVADAAYTEGLGLWAPDACGSTTAPSSVEIVDYHYDPPGRDEESMNDEWVAVANLGSTELDLGGWLLRDESTQNRFEFPVGFALAPSAEVLVRSGCGVDGPADLYWCANDPVWSNGGDTIILQTSEGTVVARHRYPGDY